MREIIDAGCLYIAQPPLYRVQMGKEKHYAYNEEQRDELIKKAKAKNPSIQRYKGLGEMNAEQLWETTMDPASRLLLRVEVDDAVQASDIFDVLMGNNVDPRRRFIETHAKDVKNLDV